MLLTCLVQIWIGVYRTPIAVFSLPSVSVYSLTPPRGDQPGMSHWPVCLHTHSLPRVVIYLAFLTAQCVCILTHSPAWWSTWHFSLPSVSAFSLTPPRGDQPGISHWPVCLYTHSLPLVVIYLAFHTAQCVCILTHPPRGDQPGISVFTLTSMSAYSLTPPRGDVPGISHCPVCLYTHSLPLVVIYLAFLTAQCVCILTHSPSWWSAWHFSLPSVSAYSLTPPRGDQPGISHWPVCLYTHSLPLVVICLAFLTDSLPLVVINLAFLTAQCVCILTHSPPLVVIYLAFLTAQCVCILTHSPSWWSAWHFSLPSVSAYSLTPPRGDQPGISHWPVCLYTHSLPLVVIYLAFHTAQCVCILTHPPSWWSTWYFCILTDQYVCILTHSPSWWCTWHFSLPSVSVYSLTPPRGDLPGISVFSLPSVSAYSLTPPRGDLPGIYHCPVCLHTHSLPLVVIYLAFLTDQCVCILTDSPSWWSTWHYSLPSVSVYSLPLVVINLAFLTAQCVCILTYSPSWWSTWHFSLTSVSAYSLTPPRGDLPGISVFSLTSVSVYSLTPPHGDQPGISHCPVCLHTQSLPLVVIYLAFLTDQYVCILTHSPSWWSAWHFCILTAQCVCILTHSPAWWSTWHFSLPSVSAYSLTPPRGDLPGISHWPVCLYTHWLPLVVICLAFLTDQCVCILIHSPSWWSTWHFSLPSVSAYSLTPPRGDLPGISHCPVCLHTHPLPLVVIYLAFLTAQCVCILIHSASWWSTWHFSLPSVSAYSLTPPRGDQPGISHWPVCLHTHSLPLVVINLAFLTDQCVCILTHSPRGDLHGISQTVPPLAQTWLFVASSQCQHYSRMPYPMQTWLFVASSQGQHYSRMPYPMQTWLFVASTQGQHYSRMPYPMQTWLFVASSQCQHYSRMPYPMQTWLFVASSHGQHFSRMPYPMQTWLVVASTQGQHYSYADLFVASSQGQHYSYADMFVASIQGQHYSYVDLFVASSQGQHFSRLPYPMQTWVVVASSQSSAWCNCPWCCGWIYPHTHDIFHWWHDSMGPNEGRQAPVSTDKCGHDINQRPGTGAR